MPPCEGAGEEQGGAGEEQERSREELTFGRWCMRIFDDTSCSLQDCQVITVSKW